MGPVLSPILFPVATHSTAVVVLPTPPLKLLIAIIFVFVDGCGFIPLICDYFVTMSSILFHPQFKYAF